MKEDAAKVVIFSQWTRMHELVAARLKPRKWGHVLFSGDVPARNARISFHRFKEDPACRLFSLDRCGGVGLNLQHASVVVNLDQPWNPAVLEQRIGRVHRLGQQRPVRVVHFISQGTIEEGMLALLGFKKSVFTACSTVAPTRSSWAVLASTVSWNRGEGDLVDLRAHAGRGASKRWRGRIASRRRWCAEEPERLPRPRVTEPTPVAVENPWNDVLSAVCRCWRN